MCPGDVRGVREARGASVVEGRGAVLADPMIIRKIRTNRLMDVPVCRCGRLIK